jgi:hypothetical protein
MHTVVSKVYVSCYSAKWWIELQLYVVLDTDKPCIKKYNLTAVKPTIVQLTSSVSEWLNKVRHNLLHEPALTETLCMCCLNVT